MPLASADPSWVPPLPLGPALATATVEAAAAHFDALDLGPVGPEGPPRTWRARLQRAIDALGFPPRRHCACWTDDGPDEARSEALAALMVALHAGALTARDLTAAGVPALAEEEPAGSRLTMVDRTAAAVALLLALPEPPRRAWALAVTACADVLCLPERVLRDPRCPAAAARRAAREVLDYGLGALGDPCPDFPVEVIAALVTDPRWMRERTVNQLARIILALRPTGPVRAAVQRLVLSGLALHGPPSLAPRRVRTLLLGLEPSQTAAQRLRETALPEPAATTRVLAGLLERAATGPAGAADVARRLRRITPTELGGALRSADPELRAVAARALSLVDLPRAPRDRRATA